MSDELYWLWATPLFRRNEKASMGVLHDKLEALILQREAAGMRKLNTPQPLHPQVFESEFDFLLGDDPAVEALRNLIHHRLSSVILATTVMTRQQLAGVQIVSESWFHITRRGGYVRNHNHPQHSLSAIYCVNAGDQDMGKEKDGEQGHLLFYDPRTSAGMFLDPTNAVYRQEFGFNAHRFRPKTGDLVIFPSYLWHAVEPYSGEVPRITVAANFRFHT